MSSSKHEGLSLAARGPKLVEAGRAAGSAATVQLHCEFVNSATRGQWRLVLPPPGAVRTGVADHCCLAKQGCAAVARACQLNGCANACMSAALLSRPMSQG